MRGVCAAINELSDLASFPARSRGEEKGHGTHCLCMHVIITEKSRKCSYDVMAVYLFSVSESQLSTRARCWHIYHFYKLPNCRESVSCNRTGSYITRTDYESILISRNVRNITHMRKQCVPGPFSSPLERREATCMSDPVAYFIIHLTCVKFSFAQ